MTDWLEQAFAAWERGDRAATIQLSQSAICEDPLEPKAYKLLGNGLQGAGNLVAAERAYRQGLVLVTDGARLQGELWANVGGISQALGEWNRAVEFYERALSVAPGLKAVYLNWVKGLEERQEIEEAIAILERAINFCTDNGDVWLQLGRLHCEFHDFEAGRSAYQKASRLMPGDAEPLFGLAHAWFYLEDFEQAIAVGQRALELNPNSVVGWSNYGVAHYELGLLDKAEQCMERSLALDSTYDDARWALANVWLHRGEFEKGFEAFEARRSRVLPVPRLPVPEWDGSDLTHKTILIYGQSGLGDMVQFARYLPLLQERGAKVKVVVPHPLVRLFGEIADVEVVDRAFPFSCDDLGVNCFTTFLSLAAIFYAIARGNSPHDPLSLCPSHRLGAGVAQRRWFTSWDCLGQWTANDFGWRS